MATQPLSDQPEQRAERLDVDIRFLLANERTLLAWLRTALSLEAGGFVLIRFGNITGGTAVGVGLVGLGTLCAGIGYLRYRSADRAIRAGDLPAPGRGPALVTISVVGLSALLLAVYLASTL